MNPPRIDSLVRIPSTQCTDANDVGAKAHSLQQVAAFGLRVPPAFVIPTGFFAPWIAQLQGTAAWVSYRAGAGQPQLCAAVRQAALALPYCARQQEVMETSGLAVSPGIAKGRIRLMRSAHDGPLIEGEVLVAVTTDPGWKPLFIHAAAVIVEVGGVLQHGAVIAREFGKPCVAGIADVTNRFKDGQWLRWTAMQVWFA